MITKGVPVGARISHLASQALEKINTPEARQQVEAWRKRQKGSGWNPFKR